MADIELVIKIPEGLLKDFELEQWTALSCMEMKNALEKATPLTPDMLADLLMKERISPKFCDVIRNTTEEMQEFYKGEHEKLEKIEQIVNNYDGSMYSMKKQFNEIQKVLE